MLLLLLACDRHAPKESDTDVGPFVETLAPDDWHILMTSVPNPGEQGHALWEVAVDLSDRWSVDIENAGALGAIREPDGSTIYARSNTPPDLQSAIESVGPDGALQWSYNQMFSGGLSFSHGVARASDDTLIVLDTAFSRLTGIDMAGNIRWQYSVASGDLALSPNGLDVTTADDGTVLIAVSGLYFSGSPTNDGLMLFELPDPHAAPTLRWRINDASFAGAWPHGPRFHDGQITVNFGGRGQIVVFNLDGEEQQRFPETPGAVAFPRDAVFLPDGSLLLSDGGLELQRVWDPFGSFEVVDALTTSGIFSIHVLDCSTGVCLGG